MKNQGQIYINTNLVISYTVNLESAICAVCSQPCQAKKPIDIIDSATRRPTCQKCAGKYATELYMMVKNYYGSISEAERSLISLF